MQPPKYDPENPNPWPAKIYTMDEVEAMGFKTSAPVVGITRGGTKVQGLGGQKGVTFVALVDKDMHVTYRTRTIELGLTNTDFFRYLLSVEQKYATLIRMLGGEPRVRGEDRIDVEYPDETTRTFLSSKCTATYMADGDVEATPVPIREVDTSTSRRKFTLELPDGLLDINHD